MRAVILAGGNGERLRPLTRQLVGDDRPKQYCPVVGAETLLDQTRRRAATLIASDRTVIVVTSEHEPNYAPALAELPACNVVEQPFGRGTAPAILYALHRLRTVAPGGAVAIMPSDHYVDDDARFMARVEGAMEAVTARPDLIVLWPRARRFLARCPATVSRAARGASDHWNHLDGSGRSRAGARHACDPAARVFGRLAQTAESAARQRR